VFGLRFLQARFQVLWIAFEDSCRASTVGFIVTVFNLNWKRGIESLDSTWQYEPSPRSIVFRRNGSPLFGPATRYIQVAFFHMTI
jgi:hypothetical protein